MFRQGIVFLDLLTLFTHVHTRAVHQNASPRLHIQAASPYQHV